MSYDPISQDPPIVDKNHPAKMMEVLFRSHNAMLNGIMYAPQGAGPHPTILLLHGFPGHERNFDLAQILRRAGYNVMIFHYRGAWGSEGSFTFTHVLEDTETVLRYLCQSEIAQHYNIDTDNISVIGHSMGGWAALHMAGKGLVKRVASIAGVNFGLWGEMAADSPEAREYSMQYFSDSISPLHNVTGEYLVDEVINNMDEFDIMQLASRLSKLDILLIAAQRDDTGPLSLHHAPLVTLLEKKNAGRLTHNIVDTDHVFSDKRIALARLLLDWLED